MGIFFSVFRVFLVCSSLSSWGIFSVLRVLSECSMYFQCVRGIFSVFRVVLVSDGSGTW